MAGQIRRSKKEVIELRTKGYRMILENIGLGRDAVYSTKVFDFILEAWRAAAKACNLQFRKGRIYTRNNRFGLPYIYLPEGMRIIPDDTGSPEAIAYGGYWVQAKYLGRGKGYRIRPVWMQRGSLDNEDAFESIHLKMKIAGSSRKAKVGQGEKSRCINKKTFDSLMTAYMKNLGKKVAISKEFWEFSGWYMDFVSHQPKRFWIFGDTILNDDPEAPFDVLDNPNHLDSPLSSLLFTSTLFSISKPLMTAAELPTAFVLYLKSKDKASYEKNYDYMHHWICYYCNPNNCDDIEENYGNFERNYVGFLSSMTHHNFPVLYRTTDPGSKYYESGMEILRFEQKEAEKMKLATTLPILLSSIQLSKKKFFEGCLTIDVQLHHNDLVFHKKREQYREQLFEFYSGFIRYLNASPEDRILQVKRYYSRALGDLGCIKKTASEKQKQIACFLTTIYLAEEYVAMNRAMLTDPFLSTKQLLQSFADGHTATEVDFAEFLQEVLDRTDNQFPVLMQDEECLYLHFKEYWESFEQYCRSKDILIKESPKEFRRKYLAPKFLKPQYAAKAGTYPRYDYRKLIGSKKETVLAVKKAILQRTRSIVKQEE